MANVNYLFGRLCKQKGVKELKIEEISLDHLLMAFMGDDSVEKTAALKANNVSVLTTTYAAQLKAGRAVAINDVYQCRIYYVKAIEGELVAVYSTMGPWFEIYSAISTNQELLIELGITTNSFKDLKIIDGIFDFPLVGKGIPEVTQLDQLEVQAVVSPWKKPVNNTLSTKEILARNSDAGVVIERALGEIIEAVGTMNVVSDEQVDELFGNQMAKALDKLKKTQGGLLAAKAEQATSETIIVAPTYGEIRRQSTIATA